MHDPADAPLPPTFNVVAVSGDTLPNGQKNRSLDFTPWHPSTLNTGGQGGGHVPPSRLPLHVLTCQRVVESRSATDFFVHDLTYFASVSAGASGWDALVAGAIEPSAILHFQIGKHNLVEAFAAFGRAAGHGAKSRPNSPSPTTRMDVEE